MKFIVFAFLLAVLAAAVAYSESEPTLPETALSEDDVDSTTVLSTSNEDSDEEEEEDSEEEKIPAQLAVTSYDAPVVGYVRTYEEPVEPVEPVEPQYVITYSVPEVPTIPAPTPAPLYGAPVSSYDPPVVLPYWLRPRT